MAVKTIKEIVTHQQNPPLKSPGRKTQPARPSLPPVFSALPLGPPFVVFCVMVFVPPRKAAHYFWFLMR